MIKGADTPLIRSKAQIYGRLPSLPTTPNHVILMKISEGGNMNEWGIVTAKE